MAYIGNTPALKYASFAVQHFTTSATTSYSLDNSVANENGIALFINNVRQQPGGSYAYTATGTTLTLSAATTTSDTMYCVFIGKAVQTVAPPAGSVAASQLATDAVTTAKILDTAVTGAKLNDDSISGQGALGAAPADTDEFLVSDAGVLKRVDYSYIKGITQTSFLPTAAPIIINGNMAVAQRGTSSTGITGTAMDTVDRWKSQASLAGTWTQTQESLTSDEALEDGFANAFKMDCTTANASLSASSYMQLRYFFEGQDLQVFKKGTSNAETYTLSFWVKSTKTGTFIAELYDNDNDRGVSTAYTISSTNTWEFKIVAFPADTTGVIGDDNGNSFQLYFWLVAGTDFTSGTLQTTWAASGSNTIRAVGQVNCADSTSNNFHITAVQLDVGTYTTADLPPFRHESYSENRKRCERYFQIYPADASGAYATVGNGRAEAADTWYCWTPHRSTMRTSPSFTETGVWRVFRYGAASGTTPTYVAASYSGVDATFLGNNDISGATAGQTMFLQANVDTAARLQFDAEL